jgi:hypothetical protein
MKLIVRFGQYGWFLSSVNKVIKSWRCQSPYTHQIDLNEEKLSESLCNI